jgi:hypothetical protein
MFNHYITFSLPQPLIYAGIGGAATFLMMKYGTGKVMESIYTIIDHPIVVSAIVGVGTFFILPYIPTPLFYMGIGGAAGTFVMKYGRGAIAQSICALIAHPVCTGVLGSTIGGIAGFYYGALYGAFKMIELYRTNPAQLHQMANAAF